MCLLLLLHRVHPRFPVVVAANRDERYDRPSAPPALSADGAVLAPRDLVAGGTWIGVRRGGLFAGLTNRSRAPFDPARPSRGAVCGEALAAAGAREAAERVAEAIRRRPTNAFNLMVADAREALVVHSESDRADVRALEPGLHVLTNEHDVDRYFVREIPASFATLDAVAREGDETLLLDTLASIVRDHAVRTPENHAICKHFEGRGTVSSSLVLVPAPPRARGRFLFAEGPPCVTPFRDVSEQWPG